ncbi:MAG: transferrin receptor-like dimerization domain-containing protein [Caulobacteraceae bacterium]|nr:transferrin receptor-like dimerization domain-containing protein [Caulobacteraceae bacterium]
MGMFKGQAKQAIGWTALAALGLGSAASAAPLLGFTDKSSEAERALEARFDAALSPSEIRERLKSMSSAPNQVGSPHDKANAEFVLSQFKAWGWDAHIEEFSVLYPTPKHEALELLGPAPFTATLTEPPMPGDATSANTAGALPAWLAFGGDGDVTAELVYVNYGMPDDYKALDRMGVSVKGKIVIVRYGGGWRGLKPKLAQEHGAVGCIIYSDPADDGYGAGDVYPKGAWRPERGIQRGSVLDMPIRAGDPLTPDVGATKDAPRIALADATTIMKIPAVPISYGDAQHFLAALGGEVAPKAWRGGLPLTYHVGGVGAQVHLSIQADWSQKPLYDVIATLKGRETPDQWVIRANHRDGWVYGAYDPLAGHSAMMEEAKSIGALAKTGWRPQRTIIYASWDGEEPGLLGSTEWAEQHAAELKAKAVLYINTDTNGRGFLGFDASYSARRLATQVAADVVDPETGESALRRAFAGIEARALAPEANDAARAEAKDVSRTREIPIGPMGSGSDYTPFVQHLGVASIDFSYRGEDEQGGIYHSAYDTFEHYDRFGDPGMVYGVAMAKTGGRLVLRAADAEIAPLSFTESADLIGENLDQLHKLVDVLRQRAEAQNRAVDDRALVLAADPSHHHTPPTKEDPAPNIDFGALDAAVAQLKISAAAFDAAAASEAGLKPEQRVKVNAILQGAEQALTDGRGLPGRPWYRHLIYAPGVLTGYGAKTLPGVREALESGRWSEAGDYVARTAQVISAQTALLDSATALLKP